MKKVYGEVVIKHLIYDLQKALDEKTSGVTIVQMLEKKVSELKPKNYIKIVWYDDKKPNKSYNKVKDFVSEYDIKVREDMIIEE